MKNVCTYRLSLTAELNGLKINCRAGTTTKMFLFGTFLFSLNLTPTNFFAKRTADIQILIKEDDYLLVKPSAV